MITECFLVTVYLYVLYKCISIYMKNKLFLLAGCKLGEASDFLVHMDARIQVPMHSDQPGCYEVCTCGQSGRLENCVEMPCIDTTQTCNVGGLKKSETAQHFCLSVDLLQDLWDFSHRLTGDTEFCKLQSVILPSLVVANKIADYLLKLSETTK